MKTGLFAVLVLTPLGVRAARGGSQGKALLLHTSQMSPAPRWAPQACSSCLYLRSQTRVPPGILALMNEEISHSCPAASGYSNLAQFFKTIFFCGLISQIPPPNVPLLSYVVNCVICILKHCTISNEKQMELCTVPTVT